MSVDGISPLGKPRGPYDHLLEAEAPEAILDPAQLRAYLDGINTYLAELDKLDLPPGYMDGINQVLDEQVSLVMGEKVTQDTDPGAIQDPCVPVPSACCPCPPASIQDDPSGGRVHSVGNAPGGMPPELWASCVEAGEKTGIDPYLLAAQMEKESQFGRGLNGSPSAGDGLMQVEPATRAGYAAKFQAVMGHAYNHGDKDDQIAMAAVILADKGGSERSMLQRYNGGDGWRPGSVDSYGREIRADDYAATVLARANAMRAGAV